MKQVTSRAFVFGDNVDTDQLAPGIYIKHPIEEISRHCLEGLAPDFASTVATGDIIVAGRNFGMGSSREQAAEALRHLGIRVIIAKSFGGIFYRNAINYGLAPLVCRDVSRIKDGDGLHIDAATGEVINVTRDETYKVEPMPQHLLQIVDAGGLIPYLENRLGAKTGND